MYKKKMEELDSPFVPGSLLCCYWPCLHTTEYSMWRENFMPGNSVSGTWNCGWTVWSCTDLFLSRQGRLANPALASKDELWKDPYDPRDRRVSGLWKLKRLGVLRQKPKNQLERRRVWEETEPLWEDSRVVLATVSPEVKCWQTHHVCLFGSPGLFLHPPHSFVTRGLAPFLEPQLEDPQDEVGLGWLKKGRYHKMLCWGGSKAPMAGKRKNNSPKEEKNECGKKLGVSE